MDRLIKVVSSRDANEFFPIEKITLNIAIVSPIGCEPILHPTVWPPSIPSFPDYMLLHSPVTCWDLPLSPCLPPHQCRETLLGPGMSCVQCLYHSHVFNFCKLYFAPQFVLRALESESLETILKVGRYKTFDHQL